ncbi:MAG: HlyD family type I secretion periplasmic adaptor subunit [candidate division NC10 bacterium]
MSRARLRARREDREFLPALLEIQDSPPSPLGMALGLIILALVAAVAAWATLGSLDVVAVARGRVITAGHSKLIQPLEAGLIRAIRVADGAAVRKGQVLVELDPTASGADETRLASEEAAARVHIARLRALLAGQPSFDGPPGAEAGLVALQRQLLADQRQEQERRLEAAALGISQRVSAVEGARANVERLRMLVAMQTERAQAYRTLFEREYVARMQYLEVEERRVDRVQELAMERQRLDRERAALAEAEKQYEVLESEFKRARLGELTEWETRAAAVSQDVVKAARRRAVQRLVSPVDGVVQQLAVHTVGGVVTPGQQLMVVVPRDAPLEVEAWVENKDVGFVRPGQPVEVKVETFPFTRYGTVAGRVTSLSGDAVSVERLGLVYAARVSLDRSAVRVEERDVALAPGMAVTVEIAIGRRRVLDFFLSPLLRRTHESLRER